ncbi:hypothetical protein EHW97_00905 [Aeromicrobium camelliae]|uniref:Uncharacterized protein n=1 Tax=Aeromicrobium camelliae TaxID=1538144 RepID=A0A3N6WRJ0_9ACTN|nr:hypothetical protein [Aeromicrobium camelliae]RQN10086.1 hypothetical protein EHW97_00905 [Aeromicrobium camelliae]
MEFIATAARDATLTDALRERVQLMIDGYREVAAAHRTDDEQLPVDDVARLMAALDQGVSKLTLGGISALDGPLLRAGLRRLVDPRGAADEPPSEHDGSAELPEVARVRQLILDSDDS